MNGEELRKIRKTLRLQQIDIAAYLDIDNETVCRWEKSNKNLNKLQSEAIERLANDPEMIGVLRGDRRARRIARNTTK